MNRRHYLRICMGMIIALILSNTVPSSGTVHADIGWPPLNPAGSSVEPPQDVNTNVRMESEAVDMTVEAYRRSPSPAGEEDPGNYMRAKVEAVFHMRNLDTKDESFDVWFPLAVLL